MDNWMSLAKLNMKHNEVMYQQCSILLFKAFINAYYALFLENSRKLAQYAVRGMLICHSEHIHTHTDTYSEL